MSSTKEANMLVQHPLQHCWLQHVGSFEDLDDVGLRLDLLKIFRQYRMTLLAQLLHDVGFVLTGLNMHVSRVMQEMVGVQSCFI
jgi:hypothetical protein